MLISARAGWAWAAKNGRAGTLDPTTVRKYVTPLVIPPAMPPAGKDDGYSRVDRYLIGNRQFAQQILPPGMPRTAVWGYGSLKQPHTFNFPAFTIEANADRPVRVTWVTGRRHRSSPHRPVASHDSVVVA
ncbi:hypothetical protein AB0B66_33655 [Catellatospora sp. NPDC049111]|uniref:hypothetical protein n=1 Tax=Catellatospora sp. NPDC049111 TaxID=3155271 RepID=UPI0033E69D76